MIIKGIRASGTGTTPVTMPVNGSSNRITGVLYDVAGNVIRDETGREYECDSAGSMVKTKGGSYGRWMVYDADDEQIGIVLSGVTTWTIRDMEGRTLREYRGYPRGDDEEYWIWRIDRFYAENQLVAGDSQIWTRDGSLYYGGPRHYHLDHLGSLRLVTDAQGRSLSENEYYPFGISQTKAYQEQIKIGDPLIDVARFAGHSRDFPRPAERREHRIPRLHARAVLRPAEGALLIRRSNVGKRRSGLAAVVEPLQLRPEQSDPIHRSRR